jgi:hypothetical protein
MQVRMGKMTIDEVPEEYREEVKKYLEGNGWHKAVIVYGYRIGQWRIYS